MEVKKRRRYSNEFKEDVLNMLKLGDKSIPSLAKELGITERIIYQWYKKSKGGDQVEEKNDKDKEIRELRKRLAEVEEERDILKKAVSIFSRQGKTK